MRGKGLEIKLLFRNGGGRIWLDFGSRAGTRLGVKARNCLAAIAVVFGVSPFFSGQAAVLETAENSFSVKLPPPPFAEQLLPGSPFGINTALGPATSDREPRLRAMEQAGIKWARQDFVWKQIERRKGEYDWRPYDGLVDALRRHGLLLFGDLAYGPDFHDTRTEAGIDAYAAFARAAASRYAGKVDYWQIWNEPNLGYHGGSPAPSR